LRAEAKLLVGTGLGGQDHGKVVVMEGLLEKGTSRISSYSQHRIIRLKLG